MSALQASLFLWQCYPDLTVGAITLRRFAPSLFTKNIPTPMKRFAF